MRTVGREREVGKNGEGYLCITTEGERPAVLGPPKAVVLGLSQGGIFRVKELLMPRMSSSLIQILFYREWIT